MPKPTTTVAMQQLIEQIQQGLPFHLTPNELCDGECQGCKLKLLEYMTAEIASWQQRLANGEEPSFGELHKFGRTAQKIRRVFVKSGLLNPNYSENRNFPTE